MAMARAETLGALLWLVGCSAAPPPCPDPAPPSPPESVIGPEGPVAKAMARALVRTGHECAPSGADAGVQICDRDVPGRATVVLVYAAPMAHLASHYRRKPDTTCAEAAGVMNQLNLAVDGIKIVCVEDRVTFVTSFLVPDNGLSPRSFAEHTERFQGQVKLLLREGDLLPLLE